MTLRPYPRQEPMILRSPMVSIDIERIVRPLLSQLEEMNRRLVLVERELAQRRYDPRRPFAGAQP
jgi:hypothetical protein